MQDPHDQATETPFPLSFQEYSVEIDSTPTFILLEKFANRVFLLITQTGKPGTLIHAKKDEGSPQEDPTYTVRTMLGERDRPVLEIYARHFVQQMNTDLPLTLSIALKRLKTIEETTEYDERMFKTISRTLLQALSHSSS
eukprot:TRINITY_DN9160_c0_g1_i1.p1 TRINITY_DN9160_c0_g1~~TRINITY_DN9160_c0_g1_i1.p1  ORF type:complete len:140 (-),score=31.99 TRINITY_DN9160_c0_g1_i1:172-591(-)